MTDAKAWRGRRAPGPRKPWAEPTLEDILAGSVVRATMSADRVDADALRTMLCAVASRLRKRTRAACATSRERVFAAGRRAAGVEIELV